MRNFIAVFFLIILLVGCGTPKEIPVPDGCQKVDIYQTNPALPEIGYVQTISGKINLVAIEWENSATEFVLISQAMRFKEQARLPKEIGRVHLLVICETTEQAVAYQESLFE